MRFFVILLLCIGSVSLLSSCIDIAAGITLNTDGSGRLRLAYTASRAFVNLGTIDEEERFYAVPVSEEDFRSTADKIDGLSLQSFSLDEKVDTTYIEATLDFDSVEALSGLFGSSGPGAIELTQEGNDVVYRQVIYGGSAEEIDGESRDFIQTFFAGNVVEFSFEAPAGIKGTSIGTFSGRVANMELLLPEVLLSSQPLVWEVRW